MKKIFLLLLLSTVLLAEDFTFSGMYLPEVRREISKKEQGFVGGCIYNGKAANGKLIKVYTKEACPKIEISCTNVIPSIRTREIDIFEIANGECKTK
jgi:hypothetical protein